MINAVSQVQRHISRLRAVGLKIEIHEIHQNLRSVYINQIPPSATKSTYIKRKLSKSNVSSHKINGFHENQCLRTYEIHAFARIQ